MKRTDSEIKQLVTKELQWDSQVKETEVGVQVKDGIVTLAGTLSSYGERQAAQRAAHRVAGVLDVANDIQVKPPDSPGRTDTEIAHAVRSALAWDVFVPHTQIQTSVSDGWVTLEGEVEQWSQRDAAERAIRNLAGVTGIINKLHVKPPVLVGDLRRSIEEALERRALRDASHIGLALKDGRVIVSGTVGSWAEKKAVLGATRGTAGILEVEDRLRIV
jgi:osmotically-inducible protein OsmY